MSSCMIFGQDMRPLEPPKDGQGGADGGGRGADGHLWEGLWASSLV